MLSKAAEVGMATVAMGWCLLRGVTKFGSTGLNMPAQNNTINLIIIYASAL